jgi:subtilisin-like proprotein convertase family protein
MMKRRFFNKSGKLSRMLLVTFALFITFTMTGGGIYLSPSVDPTVLAQDDPDPSGVNEPLTGTFSNPAAITFSNTPPFPAPSSPYPSTINVTGQGGITKVTVTLTNITHTFPDDIEVLLVSPTGLKVTLMGDCGGNNDITGVNLTFDDAAASSLPDATVLTTGTFKPTYLNQGLNGFPAPAPVGPYATTLATFNGTIQNGIWSLYTVDDTSGDLGNINGGWSITITAPTLAEMNSLAAATRDDGQSVIKWTTGYEVDNLGFNVYRQEGSSRVRLNNNLIAGSAFLADAALTAGRTYIWRDLLPRGKRDARYWIEEIDLNGQSQWHGPIISGGLFGAIKDSDFELARSATLDGLGNSANQGATVAMEARAKMPELMSAAKAGQSGLGARAGIKMLVRQEGLYKVSQQDLVAAGFDSGVNPRFIQVVAGGIEQPIRVVGGEGGKFNAGDSIEFYGVGLDSPYTDAQAYWLFAGSEPGKRIKTETGNRGPASGPSFAYTVERKDRTVYFSALRNGDTENFFGAVIAREPVDQALRLASVSARPQADAQLEVALQGVTAAAHQVRVTLNGEDVGGIDFTDQAQGYGKFSVRQSLLKEGDNTVTLQTQGGERDVSLVYSIRVTYWRDYRADNDSLALTAGTNEQVTIDGFTSSSIRVLDVTDAASGGVTELACAIQGGSVSFSAAGPGTRRLLAFTTGQIRKPASLIASKPSGLRQKGWKADFVIISRQEFFDALKPLQNLRQSQGYKVVVVDIEDVYNVFSYGNKSPQAVKDFLSYAQSSWKRAPRFVLLAGGATFDPKNYLGIGDYDLVPTKLIDTQFMETASDNWFVDFNSDGLAELAMGRLPVRTPAEAARVVEKIVSYDASKPSDGILLVADKNVGYDFDGSNDKLRGLIPSSLKVEQIGRSSLDDVTARSRLLEAINRGQKIVNYTGHGNVEQWKDNILTADDAAALTNRDSLSLFVLMTCLNGYFHDPSAGSLGEALLKSEQGGAVAVWASTGMTVPTSQSSINQELLRVVLDKNKRGPTLGEATMKAKSVIADLDVQRTWVLLGDPTTRLR